jgi:putative nucleotidyltransferase with HDIG domain
MKKAGDIVNSIGIPSQPEIMMEINDEINNPNSDLQSVSEIISRDVATAAKLLKVINSAFFGLQEKVDSIQRALSLMGLQNFKRIILSSALREAFGSKSSGSEKFWKHSMQTATIAARIAEKIGYNPPDQAYLAGLFHDCGVPLLVKKFPDYHELTDYALSVVGAASLTGKTKSVLAVEDERFSIHHCAIGRLVAKSWHLSDPVIEAIWYHHHIDIDYHKDPSVRKLSAILLLSDYLAAHLLYLSGGCPVDPEEVWAAMHKKVVVELEIELDDIKDLKNEAEETLYSVDQN